MAENRNKVFYIWNAVVTLAAMSFLIWLIYFNTVKDSSRNQVSMLPAVNATLNASSALVLCVGYAAIRKRREALHRTLMLTAFVISALFLICYVYYHSQHGDTRFLGEGWIRPVYFFILITHIICSMLVFPMILSAIYFGLTNRRKSHRRVARITLPIWLYVSVTGVLIYFFLRPFS